MVKSSLSSDLFSVPSMVLLPAQTYSPESENLVEENSFRHSFLLVPVQALDQSICEPYLVRVGVAGSGYPSTTHVKVTGSPNFTVVLLAVSTVVLALTERYFK